MFLWYQFGWIGRTVMVAAALYGLGWLFGGLGMTATARELGSASIMILSVLATLLIIRTIWRDHAGRPQR